MKEDKKYSIGKISSFCNVSKKTLHYYEHIGLLNPSEKDLDTGYRYYNKDKILQLYLIRRLKSLNFSLNEIKEHLESNNMRYLQNHIMEKSAAIEKELNTLHNKYMECQFFLKRIEQGNNILNSLDETYTPEKLSIDSLKIEEIPAENIMFIRKKIHNYRNDEANVDHWGELIKMANTLGITQKGPISVMYHTPPLEQFFTNVCDYESFITVDNSMEGPNFRQAKMFNALTIFHVGSYTDLIKTYLFAMRWIYENDYCISGPTIDSFLVSPIDTKDPNEYITKIIIPVEKTSAK